MAEKMTIQGTIQALIERGLAAGGNGEVKVAFQPSYALGEYAVIESNIRPSNAVKHWWPSGDNPAPVWYVRTGQGYLAVWPEDPTVPSCVTLSRGKLTMESEKPVRWFVGVHPTSWLEAARGFVAMWLGLHPSLRYTPRGTGPVLQFASAGPTWATRDNPLGFDGPSRRIDTPEGRQAFVRHYIVPAAEEGASGVIFWVLGGSHGRGGMYRSDGHVLPTSIANGLEGLVKEIRGLGLWCGTLMRPGRAQVASTLTKDVSLRLSTHPDNLEYAAKAAAVWAGFGFDAVYLDEVGWTAEELVWVEAVRPHLPWIMPEYTTLLGAVGCPIYWETGKQAWTPVPAWLVDLVRRLYPTAQVVHRAYGNVAGPSREEGQKRGFTPMVGDWEPAAGRVKRKTVGTD